PRVLAVVGHDRQWLEVMAAELSNGETGWIRADDVVVDGVAYSLHASLGERTLEVRRAGRVVRRVPVAVGAPETPTPTGRFAVTDKLEITDESPYGCCALVFTGHQPDVPQEWGGGDRLAAHATPYPESIGDAASLGCFRASDADMRWLIDRVPLGTVVTVTP
ncbi:MAG: L,D-transpeptidase, partial [Thermoleophilaceae bacterium]|nr:L,D-transpeptidase [Thermoleophilaceae bacterium]